MKECPEVNESLVITFDWRSHRRYAKELDDDAKYEHDCYITASDGEW